MFIVFKKMCTGFPVLKKGSLARHLPRKTVVFKFSCNGKDGVQRSLQRKRTVLCPFCTGKGLCCDHSAQEKDFVVANLRRNSRDF